MNQEVRNLKINWDFDAETKKNLFNPPLTGTYQTLNFSINETGKNFYEFCSADSAYLFLKEAFLNKPLLDRDAKNPFIFIKNNGQCPLCFIGSCDTGYFNFNNSKFEKICESTSCNYVINPREGAFFTFCASQDGSAYISKANYPFGFFYEIDACIDQFNLNLFCKDEFGNPSYTFENVQSMDNEFIFCKSNTGLCLDHNHPIRFKDAPSECNWSAYFNGDNYLNISGNCDFNTLCVSDGCFVFESYIKPIKAPNAQNNIVVYKLHNQLSERSDLNYCESGGLALEMTKTDFDLLRIDENNNVSASISRDYESGIGSIILGDKYDGFTYITLSGYWNNSAYFHYSFNAKACSGINEDNKQVLLSTRLFQLYLKNKKLHYEDHCGITFSLNGEIDYQEPFKVCLDYPNSGCNFYENCSSDEFENTPIYVTLDKGGACTWQSVGNTKLAKYYYCYDNYSCPNWFPPTLNFGAFYSEYGECPSNSGQYTGNNYTAKNYFYGEISKVCLSLFAFGSEVTGIYAETLQARCCDPVYPTEIKYTQNSQLIQECCCAITFQQNYTCPINSSIKSCSGLNLNQWNHYCLVVKDCSSSCCPSADSCMYINGILVATNPVLSLPFSFDPRFTPEGACWLNNGSGVVESGNIIFQIPKCSIYQEYIGNISEIKFTKSNSDYFCLDFNWKDLNFANIKSNTFENYIPCLSTLKLSFSKDTELFNIQNTGISYFGYNCLIGSYCVNCIYISGGGCDCHLIPQNQINSFIKTGVIDNDSEYCILVNLTFNKDSIKNYLYAYAGDGHQEKQCIFYKNGECSVNLFNCINSFSGNLKNYTGSNWSGLYQTCTKFDENAFLCLRLNRRDSVKDLFNKQIERSGLYLPDRCDFDYCYLFELADVNYSFATGQSGTWVTYSQFTGIPSKAYLNYTCTINENCSGYFDLKQKVYSYCVKINPSNYSTDNIENKNYQSNSEVFTVFPASVKKTICYCNLEFKYTPINSIGYNNIRYDIPNYCTGVAFSINSLTGCLNFPVQAFNYLNFKIINSYSLVDKVKNSTFNLNFSGLCYSFCSDAANSLNFKYFKIKDPISLCEESPSIYFSSQQNSIIENNLNLYVDPFTCLGADPNYELNHFLYFVHSLYTSGIACCTNYTGFQYGSSEYNLFMIELEEEYKNSTGSAFSGSGFFTIDQRISFSNYDYGYPISYKGKNSPKYNYILPIITGLNYYDCFSGISGTFSNCISLNCQLNYLPININYVGGNTGYVNLLDSSGNITGCTASYLSGGNFSIINECIRMSLLACDVDKISGNRLTCISKKYIYSGIQPISISTNYPLYCIKADLICSNLSCYVENGNPISGYFYYVYDVGNICKKQFKFIAPEGTVINGVNWIDQDDCKFISYGQNSTDGILHENIASINFNLTGIISCNNYYYNTGNLCININLAGGL